MTSKPNEEQYESLLGIDESSDGTSAKLPRDRRLFRHHWPSAIVGHVALIILYTGIFWFLVKAPSVESAPRKNAFPGLHVDFEVTKYEFFPNSSFSGKPRPESETAWHNLMNDMAIRVTADELAVHNQKSVSLPDGGYLAWLGVFHELHCVKLLRHWSWRDEYPEFSNLSAFQMAHNMIHIDHCLETLRSSALCRADTEALAVFRWGKKSPKPIFEAKRGTHRCVNWDTLMTSSYPDRVVKKQELDRMVNPLLQDRGEHSE